MKLHSLAISDVKLIEPKVHGDDRGFFLETWSDREFRQHGLNLCFVQDNWSRSTRGVLRGLHYQLEHAQGKLVRCVSGEVFDVAVDLRAGSESFGRWVGMVLSERNKRALWIPPGFAHGFLTLSEQADFQYKCTDIYHPESERTLRWDDPDVGIEWPVDADMSIQLSRKDQEHGRGLREAEIAE